MKRLLPPPVLAFKDAGLARRVGQRGSLPGGKAIMTPDLLTDAASPLLRARGTPVLQAA
ncbi:hypothetical protein HV824_25775 [Myxococcus sp. AM009]|uniref:hypothetical protein n=1 Tax=unclassified Myxococcus TaxID=2648731 RepID=UPI0015956C9C|nr:MULTISPECIES: hypothetical protein [unclassified Myxococcus]NVJ01503.1 hypothetical protein [Myxococcus sp. AM009]